MTTLKDKYLQCNNFIDLIRMYIITGVYPQNFEWPGVLVRGITMPTLSFTHLSEGVSIKLC